MLNKNNTIISTAIVMSLLATGCNNITNNPGPTQPPGTLQAIKSENIYASEEWKEIEEQWNSMDKVKADNFEKISAVIEDKIKDMEKLYEPLIKAGLLSKVSSDCISLVYKENLRASLESNVELPTCYDTVMLPEWDYRGADSRGELKKKLSLLKETYKKGAITKEVYEKSEKSFNDRITFLDNADKYWSKNGEETGKKHEKEIEVLLHLYDSNIGQIQSSPDVQKDLIKGAEYIVKLEK